ncbi:MAG: SUMF1/EgtB/PvdO family nonheme iron enzyme [Candidatus Delongbacteria bacterium]
MKLLSVLSFLLPSLVYAVDAPNVTISATTDGDSVYVQLGWDAVSGADRYLIYKNQAPGFDPLLIGTTSSMQFSHSMPTNWDWQFQPLIIGSFIITADSLIIGQNNLINIPPGTFSMGQTGVATPEHIVTLTNSVLISQFEISNKQYLEAAQWALDNGYATISNGNLVAYGQVLVNMSSSYCEIANDNGQLYLRRAPGADDWGFEEWNSYDPAVHPIKEVSWYGAACYCDWISIMEDLTPYYEGAWSQIPSLRNPYLAEGYRMPTEAEWEYAAQTGDERSYPWGNTTPTCLHANFRPNVLCVGWTSPVGTHPDGANSFGISDMAGNVWEWCNDASGPYSSATQTNPVGPSNNDSRVRRGGSLGYGSLTLLCAARDGSGPSHTNSSIGFRICRTVH